jgi:hypothetical protein
MSLAQRKRAPRRSQFGITLTERAAGLLRAQADQLKVRPTSLAAQLVEQALEDRAAASHQGPALLEELRVALSSLTRSHHNVSLKLLRTAGHLTAAEVAAWAKKYLGERSPPSD